MRHAGFVTSLIQKLRSQFYMFSTVNYIYVTPTNVGRSVGTFPSGRVMPVLSTKRTILHRLKSPVPEQSRRDQSHGQLFVLA